MLDKWVLPWQISRLRSPVDHGRMEAATPQACLLPPLVGEGIELGAVMESEIQPSGQGFLLEVQMGWGERKTAILLARSVGSQQ